MDFLTRGVSEAAGLPRLKGVPAGVPSISRCLWQYLSHWSGPTELCVSILQAAFQIGRYSPEVSAIL